LDSVQQFIIAILIVKFRNFQEIFGKFQHQRIKLLFLGSIVDNFRIKKLFILRIEYKFLCFPRVIELDRISSNVIIPYHIDFIKTFDLDAIAKLVLVLLDHLYDFQHIDLGLIDANYNDSSVELHQLTAICVQFELCPSFE
ncbi:hypothetical protein KCU78_g2153, partial [Aureobasidium melanogenum]